MNGRRHDIQHYEPAEVAAVLKAALELAGAADVPDDLRAAVFDKAVNLLSAKSVTVEQVQGAFPALHFPRGSG